MSTTRSAALRRSHRTGAHRPSTDAIRSLTNDPAVRALNQRIRRLMTAPQRSALQKAIRSLDRPFVEEKCQLAIDTALEIQRLGSLKRTALLQRNLWSTLDALAMHFDDTGFTPPFCAAAGRALGKLKFTDADVSEGEYRIVQAGLGHRRAKARQGGFDRRRFDAVMKLAERYRAGRHGIKNISRKNFSFAAAARTACHRPLDVLAVHRVGPLSVAKVPIAVIMGAINVGTFFVGWWPVTIVTVGVLLIIWAAGC